MDCYIHNEQCFVFPSPTPGHLTKTKSHNEHPLFNECYNVQLYSEPLAPIPTTGWPYERVRITEHVADRSFQLFILGT